MTTPGSADQVEITSLDPPSRLAPEPLGVADRSLVQQIYENIRERIINGELAPGTRLREREIALALDVSRIPVREAFPQLEAEGFIVSEPRRGSVVTQLTLRDVEELFDVRTSLESLAARLAARQSGRGATDRLHRALVLAEAATAKGNTMAITTANASLHEEIVALSGNRTLANLMRPINGRVRWLFRLTAERDAGALCREHQDLCQAIWDGNAEYAAAIAIAHVERGRSYSIEALRSILPATG
ncbi:GntR family transcriptional regulator [Pseudofrankia inefficax]|uniref:Transcriptional regulator, GntR family n=1 Tax=Pseudofrankia inefficax (strain DSM 45817 / CECT 9037 / DDB 130130 / EuI1c) TaxID=298654 RepID=E3J6E4_PSEI1|nr:GntR family transcriptional regulator [Pseudofrankia inefficax]ADP79571.1 transcriptional regulator, GntR family [Pseudofrankia inefficax]